jgi:hypothetical protein
MPLIPLADLTETRREQLRLQAMRACVQKAIEQGIAKTRKDLIVREIVPGDLSDATDFVDFDFKTAATTGEEEWTEASADLTAGDLSSVVVSGQVINDETLLGIYGFTDLTPAPDMTMMGFYKGSEVKDIWEVEHCYANAPYGGINVDENGNAVVLIWEPKDPFNVKQNHKSAANKNVVWLGFVVEKLGKRITVPQI